MTIYFASDHAGTLLRKTLLSSVQAAGHDAVDLGPQKAESVDYPDFGVKLAMALKKALTLSGQIYPNKVRNI